MDLADYDVTVLLRHAHSTARREVTVRVPAGGPDLAMRAGIEIGNAIVQACGYRWLFARFDNRVMVRPVDGPGDECDRAADDDLAGRVGLRDPFAGIGRPPAYAVVPVGDDTAVLAVTSRQVAEDEAGLRRACGTAVSASSHPERVATAAASQPVDEDLAGVYVGPPPEPVPDGGGSFVDDYRAGRVPPPPVVTEEWARRRVEEATPRRPWWRRGGRRG
jgi:hypothetical protein